jgi:putative transcriptional regulator
MAIRLRLAALIEAKGLTQSEVARQAQLSFQAVNYLYSGRAKQISLDTLDRLCRVLRVKPGELFERDGKRKPPAREN